MSVLSVRMPESLREALEGVAEAQGSTPSGLARRLIRQYLRVAMSYPDRVAQQVRDLRPDLCRAGALLDVLSAEPWLSAADVVEILDDATAQLAARRTL